MTTKTELQARIDAIVMWMRDPANAERRALFCLVAPNGAWLVPSFRAQVKLGYGVDHGFSPISADTFDDAVVFRDHNHANKFVRKWNQLRANGPAELTVMRVGDAMDAAARSCHEQIQKVAP